RARIVAVDAAAEHRHRGAAAFQRAAVRPAVDATREARDDDDARGSQLAADRPRHVRAVVGAAARPNDGNRRLREQLDRGGAAEKETGRWIVDRCQQWWKGRI